MNDSQGNVTVEYLLAMSVFVMVVIMGAGGDAGIMDAYVDSFQQAYTRFAQMVSMADIAP